MFFSNIFSNSSLSPLSSISLPSGSWQYDTYEALKKIALDLRDMAIQSDFLMPLIVGIENVDSGEEKKIRTINYRPEL